MLRLLLLFVYVPTCSLPEDCYNKKQCGCRVVKVPQCTPPPPPTCTSRSTSPYPSESRSSRPVVPTRFCEFQTRHSLPPTCKRQDFVPCRSNSRPASALGPLVTPILLQKRNDLSKHKVGKIRATKSITKEKKTEKKSDSASYTKQPMKTNKENQENEPNAENYTPKTEKVASGKEKTTMNGIMEPQDCEYAYFLLKITEDILRNNIYEDKELTILFQSHIDANKGRLDEDRMRAQIEELKRQLCLPLQRKDLCYCNKDVQASNCTYPNCQADCLCSNPCCPKQDKQTDKQVKENLPSLEERDEKPEMKEMDVDVSEPVKDTQQLDEIEEEPAQGKDENEEETKSCVCEESVTSGPEQNKQSVTSPISQGKGSPVSASRGTLDETVEAKQKESPKQEKTWADSHLGGIHSIHSVPETQEPLNELNGKGECTEPELCQQPPEKDPNEKNKLRKPPSKISYSPPCGTSVNSTYKMVPKDQKDRSQTVFYHLDNSQHCYCSVTLQKTALKIQVDDTNEEYVLVDGPVCMPRSMLESKTITVLIQNVSSIVLSSSETSGETQPEILSQVNLFQRSNGPLAANMDSISGQLQKQGNVGSNSSTKMEKECAKEPILKKAIKNYENQKSSLPSNNSQDEVSPNVQTREPSEREERPPATIQEESQHRKPLQDCGPKKCGAQLPTVCSAPCSVVLPTQTDISSAPKPDEMSNKDRTVSDVNFVEKKISSSLKKKVPSSEHGTGAQGSTGDDQVEAKKSSMSTGDGSDEKRSIHSTHAEDPVSGVGSSAVCEEKSSDILPGDAPSKKRYSDFAKKYHYLLVDASTSTSSCKVSSILKMPSKSHRDTPPQLLPSPLQLTPPQLPPPQSLSPTSPPPQTPPEVSPDESPRHSNAQNEYMLLLNEEYEADKVHLQSPLETVQHEEEEVEMPTTYNQPYDKTQTN
ncbi:uncharacterized protein DDB_G0284459-like isoform X3 [Zophobas morio]|uniref:uncharacterized protein DDB_G0284459-like isoform X3 n=1 Tax=Zophobas morio TaxID=2755281 RepID=UPI003083715D